MSFTCPTCGMTSHNPHDERYRYCGACHAFRPEPAPKVRMNDPVLSFDEFYIHVFGTKSPSVLLGLFIHETLLGEGLDITRERLDRWVRRRAASAGVLAPEYTDNVTDGLLDLTTAIGTGGPKDPFR